MQLLLFIIKLNKMKLYLYLALLLVAMGSFACEKEAYDVPVQEFTTEQRFDRAQKPQVLFQYAERQLTTGRENGWIIDRDGAFRTYERSFQPGAAPSSDNTILSEMEIHHLFAAASPALFHIEKAELAERFFQTPALVQNRLSAVSIQQDAETTRAYFAYTQSTIQESIDVGSNCNNGGSSSNNFVNITQVTRHLVEIQGPESRFTTAEKGQELLEWMTAVSGKLQDMTDQ